MQWRSGSRKIRLVARYSPRSYPRISENADLGRLTLTWIGAGLVNGAFAVLATALEGGERGAMLALAPFLTVVISAPALSAGALSRGSLHRTHTH